MNAYVVNLVGRMAKLAPEHTFIVFLSEESASLFPDVPANVVLISMVKVSRSLLPRLFAEQIILPRQAFRMGIDVMFGMVQTLPLIYVALQGPGVVAIHDIRFLDRPHDFPLLHRFYRRLFSGFSIRWAQAVLTISEFTRARIVQHWDVAPRVQTIYLASCTIGLETPSETEILNVRRKYGLMSDFILTTGSSPHKNVEGVLDAFAQLEASLKQHYVVVVFGACWGSYAEVLKQKAKALGLEDRVVLLGYIPDADVRTLHSSASAFITLSRYEGFGLSVLDSMASGVPVICSNLGSLPELVKHERNGLLVNPDDTQTVSKTLAEILTNSELRETLAGCGRSTAANFSWEFCAKRTLDVLLRIGDNRFEISQDC